MAFIRLSNIVLDFPAVEPGSYSLKLTALGLLGLGPGPKRISTIRALDGISLDLKPGARIGLYGSNGAGKTSLLRVMAGIYPPTSGRIETAGKISTLLGLGAGTIPDMSGEANIRMLLRIDGVNPTPEIVDSVWAFTEIDDKFRLMPLRSYSAGMQMRLLFSVATSVTADILLLDEWLSVADAGFSAKAEKRLAEFVDAAKILVFASHNRKLLSTVCTEVLIMSAGRITTVERPATAA
jgi:lipopolysaccharide transport system ATP-binding protein